jgi:hypothetical protein
MKVDAMVLSHRAGLSKWQDEAFAMLPEQRTSLEVPLRRWISAAEWLVLLAAVAFIGGRALPSAWQRLDTDFPNYYITARLWREGYNTQRLYEWIWFQRQKDRMGIQRSDQPVVGFLPDTPFSALVLWPDTFWQALTAKRIWIVVNLPLIVATAVLLRSLTKLSWRRIALVIALNYPLLRNLQYGQYYLLLLFLVTFALWLYLKEWRFGSGLLLGIACGLKIFPGFFLLYFVRKRDGRAAFGLLAGAAGTLALSIWAFGLQLHRTYFTQVLPWALRGDAANPYNLGESSLSSLLHKLFIFEPSWNPHPVVHAPALVAVLHPLLQISVLALAIFLVEPRVRNRQRLPLESSAFLVGLLAISTLPASYHLTLLILPAAVFTGYFLDKRDYRSLALLVILYLAACFPAWPRRITDGWWALAQAPRLYFVLLFCVLCYITLLPPSSDIEQRKSDVPIWAVALAFALVFNIVSTLRYQRGLYDGYGLRVATPADVFLAGEPIARGKDVGFIAMGLNGYAAGTVEGSRAHLDYTASDQLSQAWDGQATWIEEAGLESRIVRRNGGFGTSQAEIENAEFPVISPDGKWLAYLRSVKGNYTLWSRALCCAGSDIALTSSEFNVHEMTFLPGGALVFAATKDGKQPALYQVSNRDIHPTDMLNARYPAASPDGRWLAYSQVQGGFWNLWLRDMRTGATRRLTKAECNDVSPAWQADSKTLLYATDCGRSLWLTALNRQRVIP